MEEQAQYVIVPLFDNLLHHNYDRLFEEGTDKLTQKLLSQSSEKRYVNAVHHVPYEYGGENRMTAY